MTSSNSQIVTDLKSRQSAEIQPSSETSRTFSRIAKREEQKLSVIEEQKNLLQYSLNFLGAIKSEPLSYSEQRVFEQKHGVVYLGKFFNDVYYIPNSTDIDSINSVLANLAPAHNQDYDVRKALYELWLVTRHERMSDDDVKVMLKAYHDRLKDYPPLAVKVVCAELEETSAWFPSWSEISQRLSTEQSEQLRMFRALSKLKGAKQNG